MTDKIIDELRSIYEAQGLSEKIICKKAGISHSLLYKWMNKTHSPNVFSLNCVLQAMGYELKIVPMEKDDA